MIIFDKINPFSLKIVMFIGYKSSQILIFIVKFGVNKKIKVQFKYLNSRVKEFKMNLIIYS